MNLPTDDSNCSSGKVNMNLNLHTLSSCENSGNLFEMLEKRICLSTSYNKHSVAKWYSVSTTEQKLQTRLSIGVVGTVCRPLSISNK